MARSRELSGAAALCGGLAAVAALAASDASRLERHLRLSMEAAPRGEAAPLAALTDALAVLARSALPPALAAFLAAVLAAALQTGAGFSTEAIAPRFERLDPSKGIRRLFSPRQLLDVALGLAKALAAALLAWGELRAAAPALAQLPRIGSRAAAAVVAPLLLRIAVEIAAALLAFGALDLALQRRRHRLSLMMTRDEVRREAKEEEGDPRHKAERRRLHRGIALAGPVSRAACVVVNPTHLAVALEHRRGSDEAPVVLAKGAGAQAERIRALARRAGVPTVRDVALARALFRLAEVGETIPEELFEAAAVVLAHVYGLASGEGRR
jgi:type III secretion protein U